MFLLCKKLYFESMNYINIQHAVSVEQLLVLRLVGNYWFQFHYSVDNVFKQLIGFSNETYKQICQCFLPHRLKLSTNTPIIERCLRHQIDERITNE